jgi:hypothetical protein
MNKQARSAEAHMVPTSGSMMDRSTAPLVPLEGLLAVVVVVAVLVVMGGLLVVAGLVAGLLLGELGIFTSSSIDVSEPPPWLLLLPSLAGVEAGVTSLFADVSAVLGLLP